MGWYLKSQTVPRTNRERPHFRRAKAVAARFSPVPDAGPDMPDFRVSPRARSRREARLCSDGPAQTIFRRLRARASVPISHLHSCLFVQRNTQAIEAQPGLGMVWAEDLLPDVGAARHQGSRFRESTQVENRLREHVQLGRSVCVLEPGRSLQDLDRLAVKSLRFGEPPLVVKLRSHGCDGLRGHRMVRPELLLPQGQRLPEERLGLGGSVLARQRLPEVDNACSNSRLPGPKIRSTLGRYSRVRLSASECRPIFPRTAPRPIPHATVTRSSGPVYCPAKLDRLPWPWLAGKGVAPRTR